jgi:hypothetical protein
MLAEPGAQGKSGLLLKVGLPPAQAAVRLQAAALVAQVLQAQAAQAHLQAAVQPRVV